MTKKEAVKELVNQYRNELIARDWVYFDEQDEALCKALNIKKPTEYLYEKQKRSIRL